MAKIGLLGRRPICCWLAKGCIIIFFLFINNIFFVFLNGDCNQRRNIRAPSMFLEFFYSVWLLYYMILVDYGKKGDI